MAFENFPAVEQSQRAVPPSSAQNWKNYLLGFLIIALLATWGFMIWYMNTKKETIQQKDTVIATTSSQKDQLQKELDDATMRYDLVLRPAAGHRAIHRDRAHHITYISSFAAEIMNVHAKFFQLIK